MFGHEEARPRRGPVSIFFGHDARICRSGGNVKEEKGRSLRAEPWPNAREKTIMIREYVEEALRGARYNKLEDGTFYGEVPRLRGVLTTGKTLEDCRNQLAEVVEEWVLVRVAKGLAVPALGKIGVKVKKAG